MSILVTGSIAIDHIMVFEDEFKNHILPDKIHSLNIAFHVPSLDKRWGGTAANIAYNLRVLDVDPIVLGTVGSDLGAYADWLDQSGIRRDWIRVLDDAFTAQCYITTDLAHNQITAFHPGAMDRAHEAPIAGVTEELSVAIVGPNGKRAMLEHARALKQRGVPCIVDPGQGLPMFSGDELLEMIEGCAIYVVNDYEWAMTAEKTGLDEAQIAERVGALVVTLGEKGSVVTRGGLDCGISLEADRSEIAVVRAEQIVDPTGCGDAYRAGLLYALARGLPVEAGSRVGSVLGALKIARPGPQSIPLDPVAFAESYRAEYGAPLP